MSNPTVDARCTCDRCVNRTHDTYVMTGKCHNCAQDGIQITFRAGDRTHPVTCPTCQCGRSVQPTRLLATITEGVET